MAGYPPNWPRCVSCGDYALDGKATCGRTTCRVRARQRPFRLCGLYCNSLRAGGGEGPLCPACDEVQRALEMFARSLGRPN